MNMQKKRLIATCLLAFTVSATALARAQDTMQHMDMQGMPAQEHVEHGKQEKTAAPASTSSTAKAHAMHGVDMSSMHEMQMSRTPSSKVAPQATQPMYSMRMQGGNTPADARSPDYSDGYGYGSMPGMDMNDNPAIGMLLLDRLEYVHSRDGGHAMAIDGQAWYGKNFNKLWLKFEGERAHGRRQALRTEALWDHAASPYWDTQTGVRHDFGGGPGRTWAAFGIQGLAPYWFDVQATFYLGQGGRTAVRAAFEYEASLTQRLILQPELEANFYGKNDPRRGIGSGLSDIDAGLRLRYEIRREFAPYVGAVWRQQFGHTADYARRRGEHADDLQFVAGFRIWF